jgi:thiol:disulfide interchange protein DsbD
VLGFCAWAYGAFSPGRLVSLGLLLLAVVSIVSAGARITAAVPVSSGMGESADSRDSITWKPYSPDALVSLRAEGRPVLLDFTASWCLTCQFNERTAINVPTVKRLLQEKGITAMKGDWTNSDPAITSALKSFGRVGVPLVVYYPAGKGSDPVILPELLTEKIVLAALAK